MKKYLRRNANYKILMIVLTILLTVLGIAYSPRHASSDEDNIGNISQSIDSLTQQIQKLSDGKARISTDAETGMVRFIGTNLLNAMSTPAALGSNYTPEQAARSFLSGYGRLFGISDQANELEVMESNTVDNSRSFIHFQQIYEDIPILGGELIVQSDSNNNIISASSDILPKISLDVIPTISPFTAQATALGVVARTYRLDTNALTVNEPQLWIYNPIILGMDQNITRLVWRTEVVSVNGAPIRELVLVDAQLGFVALHFNQIETLKHRDVYTAKNGSVCTAAIQALLLNEGDPLTGNLDVDNAYNYSGYTYDFYSIEHGRNSINNAGMTIVSVVDYDPDGGCNYRNAFWNGLLMVFGTGYTSACDVVAHELTHGVTDYESNLFYYMQSGAISEAFSDIWGEFVELTYNPGELSDRWLIGEDLPTGALRDMQEPPDSLDYTQPDKMTSTLYACGDFWRALDNGGVHINSGIANKAAYLMTDGDTFNGYVVTGMGMSKTADLFYEVQTNLLTSGSDYADLYDALQQAAVNLGYNASERQTVKDAIDATEMNLQPTSCPASEAPLLASGVPYDLFFDDLESGSGNWSPGSLEGTGAWVRATGYAASGLYCLYGQDYDAINNFYIAMTSNVTLPAGSQPYLHFKHSFDFEFDSDGTWDGGVVEYSTDGGGNWNDAGSLFMHNGYTGTISAGANPLAGSDAFVGYSNGYISSRLNLSSLAGQNIRFRFRIGTDDGNLPPDYSIGWCIDDVRIYIPAAYYLNASASTGGTISSPGQGLTGPYQPGQIVNISAASDSCDYFVNWTGNITTIANASASSTTITMNDSYSITANFAPTGATYNLTINSSEYGNVTVPGEDIFGPYDCGTTINLTAAADSGYEFVNWSGNTETIDDIGSASTTITMNDNYSITANFGLEPTGFFGDASGDGTLSIMDYSSVRLMLFGKKAFNPGGDATQDGNLSIMDYSSVRLMLFGKKAMVDKYEVSYDFLSGANESRWAKSNTISSNPPGDNFGNESGWTAATTTDYDNISLNDSNVWSIAGTPGNYSALQCKFALAEIPGNITSIGITLNGSSSTSSTLRLWTWNFTTSSWTQIGSNFSMTTNIASCQAWTAWGKVYTNYINGSNMFILATLNTANANLNIDYVKLSVAHP
jgi:Zn-dependent metalloprotease